ncbi:MAG: UTP--glucose-1-phosphate uridylyltransferase [Anaerolineales bacterium]|nr:UTP--glucose-1-phosphate uridylyltransferase [Anaerolineales bacterium]MCB0027443.1 UTP--glucose-1-phosphate uridylyltransferase [Anaerolineales bacterium]MCB8959641.1 UTP--glucose-1-phosphate uridylyltransferase [Ardenticatenales bacterium]
MPSFDDRFQPFAQKMRAESLPEIVIDTFRHYYRQLHDGGTGLIREHEIRPVQDLPDAETFANNLGDHGVDALDQTIVIKLNGGLGTSMGLEKAKSLLKVKDGHTFLDIIARQAIHSRVPLVLMNSFNTQADSLTLLNKYKELDSLIPRDFVQHKVPKIRQADLAPANHDADPSQEWNPPGHGDIYTALVTSGMLSKLLAAGYRYAFVSNADNLGAVLDTRILGYFSQRQLPFMMEVADRTEADKKGGHLAQTPDGQLILRESAQCDDEDTDYFQDIDRHRYFNTNNLWLNLVALQQVLQERNGILGLPMIRNRKTINPRNPDSEPVFQLETAMGSAIATFKGAGAIRVPRHRFSPVKTTSDLLAVRSDAYLLTEDYRVILHPDRAGEGVVVDLDSRYYKLIDEMEARFPAGAPSLIDCQRLTVRGDVRFEGPCRFTGSVEIINDQEKQLNYYGEAIATSP